MGIFYINNKVLMNDCTTYVNIEKCSKKFDCNDRVVVPNPQGTKSDIRLKLTPNSSTFWNEKLIFALYFHVTFVCIA